MDELKNNISNQTLSCQHAGCFNGGTCIIYNQTNEIDAKDFENNSTEGLLKEQYKCKCPVSKEGILCERGYF